jgi:hypothetical protein
LKRKKKRRKDRNIGKTLDKWNDDEFGIDEKVFNQGIALSIKALKPLIDANKR